MDPRVHSPTGTQAHADAASSDQDRDRWGAIPKWWPALREASLPEAAPDPFEDRQDKSSSFSDRSSRSSNSAAFARRPTFQEGGVEIYSGAESDTSDYAPHAVGYVYQKVRGPRAIAGTALQLEMTPQHMGQAEP